MADVFISYRKADRAKAEALANALKVENLDVWWDVALETGETFDEKIQSVLERCKAVIVVWSKESVKSDWVRAESSIGRERGVLVPVMIQPVNIPVPFNLLHTADLIGWNGDRSHPGYRDVVKQVKEHAGKAHVKPLKPPPNRALRNLWRAVAAVAVLAAIGASVWVFRPWEALRAPDPVVEAAKAAEVKHEAALNSLAPYGVTPTDLAMRGSQHIAQRTFNTSTRAQLDAAPDTDPPVLALKCAVGLWTLVDDLPDFEGAHDLCEAAAATGEPAGHAFYGDLMMNASYYAPVGDGQRTAFKTTAISHYEKAAPGSAYAAVIYARELMDGKAITADPIKAENLLKDAQAKGAPEAGFHLGILYLRGDIQGPDYDGAIALIRNAADAGVQEAQSDIADRLLEWGGDTVEDAAAALAYRQKCTEGLDAYIAFRCTESIPRTEEILAELKAKAAQPAPN